MRVFRLPALVMFFTLCAGLALAQSQQNDAANLVIFQGAASLNWSNASVDQASTNSRSLIPSGQPSTENSGLAAKAVDERRVSRNDPPSFSLGSDSDKTCYFIRDYLVIRDSPHSDSTHRDGSFTCVPGSRFRVYTTGR
jgi:hypothetical protein